MNNEQPIIACTHDGLFHSDEVMACALLRLAAGSSHVSILCSRIAKDWERADFVLDVGQRYDGVKWFDHHQTESTGKRDDGTGYSCFGLLWKSLGITMLRQLLLPYNLEDRMIVDIAGDMENFVKGIDLHDQAQLNVNARWSVNKAVYAEVATLQSIISGMNGVPFIDKASRVTDNTQFYKALDFAVSFLERLVYRKASKVIAHKYVTTRIKPDSDILYLEEYCEWYDAVANAPHILYVIYPSSNGKAYAVQCVKSNSGASTVKNLKLPFPAKWAGLSDNALANESGVEDALFCHRDRFIASAATLKGAHSLAEKSIKLQQYVRHSVTNSKSGTEGSGTSNSDASPKALGK
jgi:uncharacterized UPF0160 family protein